jgi:hypothetical protein
LEFFTKILLVPRKDSRLVPAAQGKSTVTVKLDSKSQEPVGMESTKVAFIGSTKSGKGIAARGFRLTVFFALITSVFVG